MEVPTVEQWLRGKNILITGGTGFIGKLLIEKLLRSCPDIGDIYLLIRTKRNKSPEDRHTELRNHEIFTIAGCKYDFSKLILISADLSVAGMGLKKEDIETLHSQINIVYHVAASVKFTDPLVDSIKTNTRLTRDVVELAKGMKHLDVFVHVSTAYSNADRQYIEEKIYLPKMDWRKAISLAETADTQEVEAVAAAAYGTMPNSYTFTKNMAEHVVWDHRDQLPILIFRPVIVIATKAEPEPGWSDNFSGPEVVLVAIGKGVIRALNYKREKKDNYCPGDITVNAIIIASWKMGCHSKITNEPCDQVICSNYLQHSPDESIALGREMIKREPLPDILWTDYYVPIENGGIFLILHLLLNALPALFFQILIKIVAKRDVPLTKSIRKYYVMATHIFIYFKDKEFNMVCDNFEKTISALSNEDKKKFNTLLLEENESLIDHAVRSVATVLKLLGERKVSKEEAFRHQKRMIMIDRFCRIVLLATVLYFFPYKTIYQLSYQLFQSVFSIFV